jgi:glycosyltransferase involved in cell wall biosynthesis
MRISVALASCDGERWIRAQVESILSQLGANDELVVADASSTDRTLDILEGFADARIRCLRGLPRGDIPGSFGKALAECGGEIVFLSDQDDLWLPGKVELCRKALEDSGADLVVHDARVCGPDERILSESFLADRRVAVGFWRNLWRPGYLGCALAFRRRLLVRALPFPYRVPMHDWWLGLLAERGEGVALLRVPLILHRRHLHNANFEPGRSPYGWVRRSGFRLRIATAILLRSFRH